jgi:hypothetical protein
VPQPTTPLVENVLVQKTAMPAKIANTVNSAPKKAELVGFANNKHRKK